MAGASTLDEDGRSRISTHSYRSGGDAANLVRKVDGRITNALSDQYYLPPGALAHCVL
ncbi:hypothetical protein FRB91_010208 [Serendipita sp. 411]|nr:hypothetical protein FRC15_009693 [Serendipita sp. 397]KAG8828628.1 hypothetical protein FRC19_000015 [Serendipita sp. 401]KAG8832196.1 hypothetical protein FRC18_005406 [Serendipita sp. 400]KAG8849155.1 hypothetical protein FRB91_010208 [Serendipita sp. 411]KAG9058920.1 hypothetical protein FS842_000118 [Serendipita sp. 407]